MFHGEARYRGAAVAASDLDIRNYALALERLEHAFYTMAVASVPFEHSTVRELAKTIQADESAHVAALTAAIKSLADLPVGAANSYNFGANAFKTRSGCLKLRYMLEDTGVHAYLGAAGLIKSPQILLIEASAMTVEARHAGAIGY